MTRTRFVYAAIVSLAIFLFSAVLAAEEPRIVYDVVLDDGSTVTVSSLRISARVVIPPQSPDDPTDPTPATRTLLSSSALELLGVSAAPRSTDAAQGSSFAPAYGRLAYDATRDTYLLAGRYTDGLVGEFGRVAPVPFDGSPKAVPAAPLLGAFFDPSGGRKNSIDSRQMRWGGLYFDRAGELSVSWFVWYNVASTDFPALARYRRDAAGTWSETAAPFRIAGIHAQRYAGYLGEVPAWFADRELGGRRRLAGFQVRQGQSSTNLGPGIYAYRDDGSDPVALLEFPFSSDLQSADSDWTACDDWAGVAWVDTGTAHALLFVGQKGSSDPKAPAGVDPRLGCYGPGIVDAPTITESVLHRTPANDVEPYCWDDCSAAKGYHCAPYRPVLRAYRPEDLARAARGEVAPHLVRPRWEIDLRAVFAPADPCAGVGGIVWDADEQRLVIVQLAGDGETSRYTRFPLLWEFHVR